MGFDCPTFFSAITAGGLLVGNDGLRRRVPQKFKVRRAVQREDTRDEGKRRSGASQSVLDEWDVQAKRAGEKGIRTPVR